MRAVPRRHLTQWYPQPTRVAAQTTSDPSSNNARARHAAVHDRMERGCVKILARDTREMSLDQLIRSKAGAGDHYYLLARPTRTSCGSLRRRRAPAWSTSATCSIAVSAISSAARGRHGRRRAALSLNAREAERIQERFLLRSARERCGIRRSRAQSRNAASVIDPNTQPFGALEDVREVAMQTWRGRSSMQDFMRRKRAPW